MQAAAGELNFLVGGSAATLERARPQDFDALYKAGASAIFPPGTVIADAAVNLIGDLNKRLGYSPKQAAE